MKNSQSQEVVLMSMEGRLAGEEKKGERGSGGWLALLSQDYEDENYPENMD